ncbi:MAG: glycerol-3-phosphate 1-O-acyltransferase PlsY [Maritimibacter sp.]
MTIWMAGMAAISLAYLLGAVPFGYIAGRLVKGIDIREHGSNSTGASNVFGVVGPVPAAVVLVLDVLKGSLAVVLTRWIITATMPVPDLQTLLPWVILLSGLAAILGHSRSVWLGFSGGKSVATGLGVLLAMAWPVGVAGLLVFAASLAVTRFVAVSSILAALSAILFAILLNLPLPYLLLISVSALYVVWRHRSNLQRLRGGTEPRLGQKPD